MGDLSSLYFDYSWLELEDFIHIAHRGGDHLKYDPNTKTAITASVRNSARFIEVDMSYDKDGNIICQTVQPSLADACNLSWLAPKSLSHHFFVIVDLKLSIEEEGAYRDFYMHLANDSKIPRMATIHNPTGVLFGASKDTQ